MALSLDKITAPIQASKTKPYKVVPVFTTVIKFEPNEKGSKFLEAQGSYNKAIVNLTKQTINKTKDCITEFARKISTFLPEGKDYYYDVDGKLTLANAEDAKQLAQDAFLHKFISQIETDKTAVDEFLSKLNTIDGFSEADKFEKVSKLSQKRINTKTLPELRKIIGITSTDKTDAELTGNLIAYLKNKNLHLQQKEAQEIIDILKDIDEKKLLEHDKAFHRLQNAQNRLQADIKTLEKQQNALNGKSNKKTVKLFNDDSVIFKSIDAKAGEIPSETIVLDKKTYNEFLELGNTYGFLDMNNKHLQHRLLQRFAKDADKDGNISLDKIKKTCEKIKNAIELPYDELCKGVPSQQEASPRLGVFLSNGSSSRGKVSLLLPSEDGTYENMIFDRGGKLATVVSQVKQNAVSKNFVPVYDAMNLI